jgi:hypothetical protein
MTDADLAKISAIDKLPKIIRYIEGKKFDKKIARDAFLDYMIKDADGKDNCLKFFKGSYDKISHYICANAEVSKDDVIGIQMQKYLEQVYNDPAACAKIIKYFASVSI